MRKLKSIVNVSLVLIGILIVCVVSAEKSSDQSQWLINTLKDSFLVSESDVLRFDHNIGDVRIKTADTDRIQITAIAQYHNEDPHKPIIKLISKKAKGTINEHRLTVNFSHLEIADNEEWSKRRIDVGIIVPEGLKLRVETQNGLIQAKQIVAATELKSHNGDIEYQGSGNIKAYSERGSMFFKLYKSPASQQVNLSTLTGDIHIVLLEQAKVNVNLKTRGPITTDYSIKIDRKPGSPLKQGFLQTNKTGSNIKLESHSGGIRVQMINAVENK